MRSSFFAEEQCGDSCPNDTQWFEVELTTNDLARIRVFPRAHWRRMAQESYFLGDVVERIRSEYSKRSEDEFFGKVASP